MNVFEIKKVPLGKNFTGVNTEALGQAMCCQDGLIVPMMHEKPEKLLKMEQLI